RRGISSNLCPANAKKRREPGKSLFDHSSERKDKLGVCAVQPVSHPTPITPADTTTRSTLGRPGDRRGRVDVSVTLRMVVMRMLHALVAAGYRTFLHAGRGWREQPARGRDGVHRGPNPRDGGGLPPRAERPLGRVLDADRGVCGGFLVAHGFGCALRGF